MDGVNTENARVHFGQLCDVHISRLELPDMTDNGCDLEQHALVEFLIRAHKTRATCTYVVRLACIKSWGPMYIAQMAWEDLTGLRQMDVGHIDRVVSPAQEATLDEVKHFVCTETAKQGTRLPLTVV